MSSITDKIHETYTSDAFTFSKLPVGDITILDNNDMYVYNPKEDITTLELAHLLRLFTMASASVQSFTCYDFWGFVKNKNLTRHFDKK